jgi:hypothetical protein
MRSGTAAEFETPEKLLEALGKLREAGLTRFDSFTPWPLKQLDSVLDLPPSRVNKACLFGGLIGATTAYVIQWWTNAWDYPLIVGSRPPHAWPAFVPIVFETTVLFAGFASLFSMLWFCGLPELWSPVFEIDGFESASIDRFWLAIDARDDRYDAGRIRDDLVRMGALKVRRFGSVEQEER